MVFTCLILDLMILIIDFFDEWKFRRSSSCNFLRLVLALYIVLCILILCYWIMDRKTKDSELIDRSYSMNFTLFYLCYKCHFGFLLYSNIWISSYFWKNILANLSLKDAPGSHEMLMFFVPCIVIQLRNLSQQNAHCFKLMF